MSHEDDRQGKHRRGDSITQTPKHRNIHRAAAGAAASADGDGDGDGGSRPKATVPAGAEHLMGLFSPPLDMEGAADGNNADNINERDTRTCSGDAAAASGAPIRLPPKPSRRRMVDPSSSSSYQQAPANVPPGAAGLVGMFAPPPPAMDGGRKPNFGTNEENIVRPPSASGQLQRQRTEKSCNTSNNTTRTNLDNDRPLHTKGRLCSLPTPT